MQRVSTLDDTSDLRRGKVTSLLIPQEDLLERLISDLNGKDKTWRTTKKGMFGRVKSISPCTWKNVICNEGGEVTSLNWSAMALSGLLQWDNLPRTLLTCDVSRNRISGNVQLDRLNPPITVLDTGMNFLGGGVELTNLPDSITRLSLNTNVFGGSINLYHLPQGLERLMLHRNSFDNCPDLSCLPSTLQVLNLSDNTFSGVVKFDTLPAGLILLWLQGNSELSGEIDESLLPIHLRGQSIKIENTSIYFKQSS